MLSSTIPRFNDIGTNQPSQSEEGDDNFFDFSLEAMRFISQPNIVMEEQDNFSSVATATATTSATEAANEKPQPKQILHACPLANGQNIPVSSDQGSRRLGSPPADLRQLLSSAYRISSHN